MNKNKYQKAYYQANKYSLLKKQKEWVAAHREKVLEYNRAYNKIHGKQYNRTIKGRYSSLKKNAKPRGYLVEMSLKEYAEITKTRVCHYCGKPVSECGGGLDRKNNEPYYRLENVVECCKRCNATFQANFNYLEKLMIAKTIKIIDELRSMS